MIHFDHDAERRRWLAAAGATGLALALGGCAGTLPRPLPPPGPTGPVPADDATLLDDLEQRSFAFFRDTTPQATGLAPDRWPSPSFASIAAVGFSLSAHVIGAGQGWISHEHARNLVLNTLRFFRDAPQGPGARGTAGYRGFYYHFIDTGTGAA